MICAFLLTLIGKKKVLLVWKIHVRFLRCFSQNKILNCTDFLKMTFKDSVMHYYSQYKYKLQLAQSSPLSLSYIYFLKKLKDKEYWFPNKTLFILDGNLCCISGYTNIWKQIYPEDRKWSNGNCTRLDNNDQRKALIELVEADLNLECTNPFPLSRKGPYKTYLQV